MTLMKVGEVSTEGLEYQVRAHSRANVQDSLVLMPTRRDQEVIKLLKESSRPVTLTFHEVTGGERQ